MNMGKVTHSPPPKKEGDSTGPGVRPKRPNDQEFYTAAEVEAMNPEERQWINQHPYLCYTDAEDLIDYEEEDSMNVDGNKPPVKFDHASNAQKPGFEQPEQKPNLHSRQAPELALYQETDVSKVLRSWPDKDSPKFAGGVGICAAEWLRTMSVLLADRQAHPGVWHIAAGQRLTSKAFRDWTDAAFKGTRPTNWEGFQSWLSEMCPLGVTPDIVAAEFDRLKQEPNEACQLFYERFCEWQVRAKATGFGHDERTAFVKRLTPGLSKKVNDAMLAEEIRQSPMTMQQVFWTACAHDRTYRTAQAAPVSGNSKRQAEGDGGGAGKKKLKWPCHNCGKKGHTTRQCPEPKSEEQKAWEKANSARIKESKKE
ncbi:hypothetical protein PCANC_27560 [Puccinia coronata f. sp. avenae]|uniref:CCHC-type domain-containing protein n=1 Tax=Puccinia coronata f. sp. avenae TaxID=200324 RepID=A0A2N5RXM9_9BASI|nr:hypothetical protein PCANC_27560 [Puccinia coronata f. sp. avenae]